MAKIWNTPVGSAEVFTANDSVATCGVNEKGEYLFTCNAPKGDVYIKNSTGTGYVELGGYHPCGSTHTAATMDDFIEGFVDVPRGIVGFKNGIKDDGEEATIWVEYNNKGKISNWHATKNVDFKTWTEPQVRS